VKTIYKNNIKINTNDDFQYWWENIENWENNTYKILDKYVTKDSICIDLGSWIGPITLYLANICKYIHAIEPDVVAINYLKKNISVNNFSNIEVYNCAISNYEGFITLGNDTSLGNSITRRNQSLNAFDVNCYTLSTFCKNNKIDNVDFIKIDIEGSEELIFDDIEFFEKYKPTVYVQLHNGWFVDENETIKKIKKIANMYTFIMNEDFTTINVNDILNGNIIFTNIKSNI
jgi:FkbM family methyltransferase